MSPVEAYIAAQPPASQLVLHAVRNAIRRGMPQAEEAISYNIPTYRLAGRAALYFAGWKTHVSLYPTTTALMAEMGDALAPYLAAKNTLQFKFKTPPPLELIEKIAAFRATEDY